MALEVVQHALGLVLKALHQNLGIFGPAGMSNRAALDRVVERGAENVRRPT